MNFLACSQRREYKQFNVDWVWPLKTEFSNFGDGIFNSIMVQYAICKATTLKYKTRRCPVLWDLAYRYWLLALLYFFGSLKSWNRGFPWVMLTQKTASPLQYKLESGKPRFRGFFFGFLTWISVILGWAWPLGVAWVGKDVETRFFDSLGQVLTI